MNEVLRLVSWVLLRPADALTTTPPRQSMGVPDAVQWTLDFVTRNGRISGLMGVLLGVGMCVLSLWTQGSVLALLSGGT
jgi:hypothetical protein